MSVYRKAAERLQKLLDDNGIDCQLFPLKIEYRHRGEKLLGYQVDFPQLGANVVCSEYSYGGQSGLWESQGFKDDGGDVTGWLTAEQVVNKVKKESRYCLKRGESL